MAAHVPHSGKPLKVPHQCEQRLPQLQQRDVTVTIGR